MKVQNVVYRKHLCKDCTKIIPSAIAAPKRDLQSSQSSTSIVKTRSFPVYGTDVALTGNGIP